MTQTVDTRNFWTEEDDNFLRARTLEGWSYSKIAAAISRTRSAVSGRVDRLGIKIVRESKKAKGRTKSPTRTDERIAEIKQARANWKPRIADVTPLNISMEEMKSGIGCRYPTTDAPPEFLFCGQPGHPWCPAHRDIVFDRHPKSAPNVPE